MHKLIYASLLERCGSQPLNLLCVLIFGYYQ